MTTKVAISRAFAAAVLVGAGLAAGAGPAVAVEKEWTVVPANHAAGRDYILNSVAVVAPGDVWAVGSRSKAVDGGVEFRALAEHYNGFRFVSVPTPDRETAPAVDVLEDVSGTSASDVWAVGTTSPVGVVQQTLVERWDGAAWTIVPSADPGAHGNTLEGVAAIAPNDAWVVGARQPGMFRRPMAEHWDGASWTAMNVPNPSGCTGHSYLTDVSAATAPNVWATGSCGSGGSGAEQGFVVRWNGTKWTIAAAFGVLPADSQLYGVSAFGVRTVWAVGEIDSSGSTHALALLWNGTTWTQQVIGETPEPGTLRAIAAVPSHHPWSAGDQPSASPPARTPITVKFASHGGEPFSVPVTFGSLRGVALDPGVGTSGTTWAVGVDASGADDVPLVLSRELKA